MKKAGVEIATGYVFMTGQRTFVANRYAIGENASVLIFDPWKDIYACGMLSGEWSVKKL